MFSNQGPPCANWTCVLSDWFCFNGKSIQQDLSRGAVPKCISSSWHARLIPNVSALCFSRDSLNILLCKWVCLSVSHVTSLWYCVCKVKVIFFFFGNTSLFSILKLCLGNLKGRKKDPLKDWGYVLNNPYFVNLQVQLDASLTM